MSEKAVKEIQKAIDKQLVAQEKLNDKLMDNKTEDLLQAALYHIIKTSPFIGGLLQELTFKFDNTIPTAAIGFNAKLAKYELYFNLGYFHKLKKLERIAVLEHEILHFLHEHIFRWARMDVKPEDRRVWNLVADMAINQYISNLPKGTINVDDWKTHDGQPFPKFKPMEEYHKLIQDNRDEEKKGKDLKDGKGNPEKDKHGNKMVDKDGKPYDEPGTGNEGSNKEILDKYTPMDEHIWDELSEEEKERMAREAQKLIQRTIEKTSYGHSMVPGFVKDMLKNIEEFLNKLNYKQILQSVIKKTVMSQDRKTSWKRPNKRYGNVAPGTTLTRTPKIWFFCDTSGSMSYKEINGNLDLMDGFMKAGNKESRLVLWHTQAYFNKKYKLKTTRLKEDDIQAGGTDADAALDIIHKMNPELSILFTDGFYDKSKYTSMPGEVIWIITKDGNKDHPNKHIGRTILLSALK